MGIFKLNGVDYMGGGNANEEILTWAEYCALTEEEKANGTTYYITDINGEGKDGFQPVIYSTEEREIGVWTDGKPLYEKTIINELTLTSSWQQYTSSSDMDTIVSVNCNYLRDGENTCGAFSTNEIAPWLNRNNYIQVCGTGSATSGWKIISMTIRYTKTTDQPGSGTWTPQGVPAVHYDDNEKVIGTWFGETLYEKSYELTLPNSYDGQDGFIVDSDGSFIDKLISCEGSVVDVNGYITNMGGLNAAGWHLNLHRNPYNVLLLYGAESPAFGGGTAHVTIRYTKSSS